MYKVKLEDNAPSDVNWSIQVWMGGHKIKTLSRDLNPLWNVIRRKTDGHKPSNKAVLIIPPNIDFWCSNLSIVLLLIKYHIIMTILLSKIFDQLSFSAIYKVFLFFFKRQPCIIRGLTGRQKHPTCLSHWGGEKVRQNEQKVKVGDGELVCVCGLCVGANRASVCA